MKESPDLPIEIWDMIIRRLDRKSQKNLRLVSSFFDQTAAPLCFETVRFDLVELLPLSHLFHIATHQKLRNHVKRLILQRRYGLRGVELRKVVFNFRDNPDDVFEKDSQYVKDVTASRVQWSLLSESEQVNINEEYKADQARLYERAFRITKGLVFRKFGCDGFVESVHPPDLDVKTESAVDRLIQQFDKAIRNFTNLEVFTHEPAHEYVASWATRWRRLCFARDGVEDESIPDEDEDIEALQLSIVLRALGWVNYYNRKLRSLRLVISGPAFWSAKRLQWLWQGNPKQPTIRRFGFDPFIFESDSPHQRELTEQEYYQYNEQLFVMNHAFVHLRHLDFRVDMYDEDFESNKSVQNQMIDFLQHCSMLQELKLAVGVLAAHDILMRAQHVLNIKPFLIRLTKMKPWPVLTELDLEMDSDEDTLANFLLSVAPALRKLTLQHIRIIRLGGSLDSFLPRIGKILPKLESLELSDLRDYLPRERVILKRLARVWQKQVDIDADDDEKYANDVREDDYYERDHRFFSGERNEDSLHPCYGHYEEAIVKAILNKEDVLPNLNPIAFLREHRLQGCVNFGRLELELGRGTGADESHISAKRAVI